MATRVAANLGTAWSLSEAAALAHMSPTYFSSFFQTRVGIPFSHWLRALRVAAAIQLLLTTERPVADIALIVGFRNTRNLQRAFHQTVGGSARSIRRRAYTARTGHAQ